MAVGHGVISAQNGVRSEPATGGGLPVWNGYGFAPHWQGEGRWFDTGKKWTPIMARSGA